MKSQLKYIELKSGYADNGPAWIGKVEFSKSGRTVYFDGHAFKGNGHGECYDIETGELYWISGVKKDGHDRHWAGGGKIMIDRQCIDEYLSYMKLSKLDMSKLEPVDIIETNKRRFSDIQNETMDSIVNSGGIDNFGEFSDDELNQTIRDLRREESYTNPRDGKKFISIQRIEAEENMRRREVTADK